MSPLDAREIGERVERLIREPFRGDLGAAASYLDTDVGELRRLIDGVAGAPNIDLLANIVRQFGICANWLVRGEYDARSHLLALEDADQGRDHTRQFLRRALEGLD